MSRRRAFDPRVLFEPRRFELLYKTERAVLDAVHAGAKAMSRRNFWRDHIARGDRGFGDMLEMALERGLALVLHSPQPGAGPDVYALPLDQMWRISALDALHETAFTDGAWTNAVEMQASLLLGYTKPQRDAWLAHVRQHQATFGGETLYVVLAPAQRRVVRALGGHSLGDAAAVTGMTFLFRRMHQLKRDAFQRIPAGTTLARIGVAWSPLQSVLEEVAVDWRRTRRLIRIRPTVEQARILVDGMRSKVEVLTARGWR